MFSNIHNEFRFVSKFKIAISVYWLSFVLIDRRNKSHFNSIEKIPFDDMNYYKMQMVRIEFIAQFAKTAPFFYQQQWRIWFECFNLVIISIFRFWLFWSLRQIELIVISCYPRNEGATKFISQISYPNRVRGPQSTVLAVKLRIYSPLNLVVIQQY